MILAEITHFILDLNFCSGVLIPKYFQASILCI